MKYQIIRSARKTLSLRVTETGEVVIRAPQRCPKEYIDRFVTSKSGWIAAHLETVRQRQQARQAFSLRPGDTLRLLGERVPVLPARDGRIRFENQTFWIPDRPFDELRRPLIALYRKLAAPELRRRADETARLYGVRYTDLRVGTARRQWASCTWDGVLTFSWRVILAPPEDVDYIVAHELCHRRHFDHSPAFWADVESLVPDYPERKKSLQRLQNELLEEGWLT